MDHCRVSLQTKESLQKTYDIALERVQLFRKNKERRLELIAKFSTTFDTKLQLLKKTIADQQKDILKAQEEIESYRTNADELSQQVTKIRKENEALQIRQQNCPLMLKKKEFAVWKEDILARKATVVPKEKIKADIAKFRSVLNIDIKRSTDNSLIFVFTQVDENEIVKTFFFKLRVEDDIYKIPACEPPVNDLNKLVDNLNSSNNLQSFVVQMRKKFFEFAHQS